jgi:hypothetical protein
MTDRIPAGWGYPPGHLVSRIRRPSWFDRPKFEPVMEGTKECRRCWSEKPVTEFYPQSTLADGRSNYCACCAREMAMTRYYAKSSG